MSVTESKRYLSSFCGNLGAHRRGEKLSVSTYRGNVGVEHRDVVERSRAVQGVALEAVAAT